MSFVRSAEHVKECRAYLNSLGAKHIGIIAKIETRDAVQESESIIAASDGIMVARGDLGAQIPMEQLPMTQEILVDQAHAAGKIVIVATNMLESMINHPTPTRAELTDVHSAVRQRVDATMLSGETAIGQYPLETVNMMCRIIEHTESIQTNKHKYFQKDLGIDENKKLVIKNALKLADDVDAKAIVVFTHS
jgi:pyruvate kinase